MKSGCPQGRAPCEGSEGLLRSPLLWSPGLLSSGPWDASLPPDGLLLSAVSNLPVPLPHETLAVGFKAQLESPR